MTNRQIVLEQLPQGKLSPDHFRLTETATPTPGDGEVLLRTRYISLDAANRAWMQGATYRAALAAGDVMAGGSLAEVVESKAPGLAKGDFVFADTGWQDYAVLAGEGLSKLPDLKPMTHLLSVYGVAGLTAYFGLLECGQPKAGETVVVSAAAGSVGSLVGQIAKIRGCKVVGIAGGAEKCAWLKDELGFDEAVDYKAGDVRRALRAACPKGIDVYFDNVGGDVFEAALFNMNNFGRIACCGAVSQYDGSAPPHGPRGIPGLIVTKRLNVRGFIVSDFNAQREAALSDLESWVETGKLEVLEDVIDGLENAPSALVGLLAGENRGKRMVKVS
ncbi:NADP-dependent oxidoreductase [Phenylobacterium sp. Root700]|uniref:NADP-dependent oxidoreductase n=1 Tax=Phenylobacterium sp. Root700 TaxID=1736591 RepID=UPI0006FC3BC1|nr:NADP-dependent oxidoreductase [Phenylobacterium sp. Root700]KRB44403.1 NADP-dependent oxidoreductase [Phenylobacterium sp. Root700]